MSQCVPNWDVEDAVPSRFDLRPHPSTSTSTSSALDVPMLDYEMAELTWENGQLSMHGLGLRRLPGKPNLRASPEAKVKYAARAAAAGTLESIVDLATLKPPPGQSSSECDDADLVPCFGKQASGAAPGTMDALVPCRIGAGEEVRGRLGSVAGSCSEPARAGEEGEERSVRKRASLGSTFAGESWHVPTVDTCDRGVDFTSTSFCSQGNTLSSSGRPCTNTATTVDDHDSVCHSRPQRVRETGSEEERNRGNAKSSSSNRRSRAAAIHNQSERKRRDKINQKMKTLQKLVPNSNKTDKASMLDEVIEYLKQLQAQVHMMSRMSIPSMMSMMPQLAIQQQLQMSMMAAAAASPMGMGMGFGMGMMGMPMTMPMPPSIGMDITMARQPQPQPVLHPTAAFIPSLPAAPSWEPQPDRFPSQPQPATSILPSDPISTYLACLPQPVTVEAYSRMIAMIQQQQQHLTSTSKH